MIRRILIAILLLFLPVSSLAYEGFGDNVTGGQGYSVVNVTNLNNSGAGSLRAALEGQSDRIVQFTVGGTITLSSAIGITGANITVDGFSAPDNGITLTSTGGADIFQVHGAYDPGPDSTHGANVIIRGFRFRNSGNDSVQIAYNAHDVVVDHCSIDSNGDGAVDVTEGSYNVTVSWSIVSNSIGTGPFLLAFDSDHVSYHHNIMYGNTDRNPIPTASHVRNYSTGPQRTGLLADVRYNVIWEYGIGSFMLSSDTDNAVASANVIGNIYKNNASYNASNNIGRSSYSAGAARAHAYVSSNVSAHDLRGTAYNYGGPGNGIPDNAFTVTSANMQGDQASAYAAPTITGPASATQQAMIDMWAAVKAGAGVIGSFPDDAVDAATRAGITIPTTSAYSSAWNSDSGPVAGDVSSSDTTPSVFSFTDQTGVALSSTNNSDNVTTAGFDNTTTLVLTGDASCKYSINGAAWATANDNVTVGDNVALQNVASGSYNTAISCTLNLGGVTDTWSRTTLAAISDPVAPRFRGSSMSGGWR